MTRKEAIKNFLQKALEQEPCDAISRQAVLDYIYNDLRLGDEEIGNDVERQMELERFYKYVKSMPPVTPQPKPCDDCISRQAVIEYIEGSGAELGHDSENELVCQDIKDLPPVNPQPETMSDLVIVKMKDGINIKPDIMGYWQKEIMKQKEKGVIVLPWFLTAVVVSEDTEIQFDGSRICLLPIESEG